MLWLGQTDASVTQSALLATMLQNLVSEHGHHIRSWAILPLQVARDVKFLATVAALGCACTLAYDATKGSLWAAIATHWLITYPWMVTLAGYRSTHTPTP